MRSRSSASPNPLIELMTLEPGYVGGEETAVIGAIGGGPALPFDKPPRLYEAGATGQLTLVANAETLANVPAIATLGPQRYRELGTRGSPGTFLVTVSGDCEMPGLHEVPLGVTMHAALDRLAGIRGEPRGLPDGGILVASCPPAH